MNNPALLEVATNTGEIASKFDLLVQKHSDGYFDDKTPKKFIDDLLQTLADERGVPDLILAASTNREVADVEQNATLAKKDHHPIETRQHRRTTSIISMAKEAREIMTRDGQGFCRAAVCGAWMAWMAWISPLLSLPRVFD
eukprot:scaffold162_cov176-Amphora_coffeaeformis.AAC.34